MHSKKIGNVFSIGLIHCFFVRFIRKYHWLYHERGRVQFISPPSIAGGSRCALSFDETNVAASFDARHSYPRRALHVCAEAQVFFEVVWGDMVSPHR